MYLPIKAGAGALFIPSNITKIYAGFVRNQFSWFPWAKPSILFKIQAI